jgi:hypothetical protein
MESSTYRKIHRDILLEWVYSDQNFITEPFKILNNSKDQNLSYIGGGLTLNNLDNQLFPVDIIKNRWAKINTTSYNFLSLIDYNSTGPVKHDVVRINFPSNFNFREYVGLFLRIYTYDYLNKKLVYLSNYFYDRNDFSRSDIDDVIPPFLYEERLWSKKIELQIPSVNWVSLQRSSGYPIPGTINDVLTGGFGLSITAPIFVDFSFISGYETIGSQSRYILVNPFTVQVPQSQDIPELQLYAQESTTGDYFEFYPVYNNSFDSYISFIEQSKSIGKVYYTEFLLTVFEQNIKGKTTRFLIDSDFAEIIEWRPIIKASTTIASIDIEMRLIDKVDGSITTRKAVYGLKPNQVSKYSLNLKKTKIKQVQKPKIYVKKKIEMPELDSLTKGNLQEVVINVDAPTLIDLNGIYASSPNDLNPMTESTLDNYHPLGQMKILIEPFDNIIKFSLAFKDKDKLDFLDLTNCQNLLLTFKSDKMTYDFGLIQETSNLKIGSCSFRVNKKNYDDLKKMYVEKNNVFYITTINNNVRTVIYSALFLPSDTQEATTILNSPVIDNTGDIKLQEETTFGTATVTRKLVQVSPQISPTSGIFGLTSSII